MATKSELAAQIEKLHKQMEAAPDDDGVELLVEKDGIRTTLRGAHATRLLKKWGLDADDEAPAGAGEQGGDEDQGDEDAGPADAEPDSGHRYFKRK